MKIIFANSLILEMLEFLFHSRNDRKSEDRGGDMALNAARKMGRRGRNRVYGPRHLEGEF